MQFHTKRFTKKKEPKMTWQGSACKKKKKHKKKKPRQME